LLLCESGTAAIIGKNLYEANCCESSRLLRSSGSPTSHATCPPSYPSATASHNSLLGRFTVGYSSLPRGNERPKSLPSMVGGRQNAAPSTCCVIVGRESSTVLELRMRWEGDKGGRRGTREAGLVRSVGRMESKGIGRLGWIRAGWCWKALYRHHKRHDSIRWLQGAKEKGDGHGIAGLGWVACGGTCVHATRELHACRPTVRLLVRRGPAQASQVPAAAQGITTPLLLLPLLLLAGRCASGVRSIHTPAAVGAGRLRLGIAVSLGARRCVNCRGCQ